MGKSAGLKVPIEDYQTDHNLTNRGMATLLNMTEEMLWHLKNGSRKPGRQTLEAVARLGDQGLLEAFGIAPQTAPNRLLAVLRGIGRVFLPSKFRSKANDALKSTRKGE